MLAVKYGYYPKDEMVAFKCEELIDLYNDILPVLYKPFFQKDPEE